MTQLLNRLEVLKDLVQESLEQGLDRVQTLHRSIDTAILEASGSQDLDAVKLYRQRVEQVYGLLRQMNQEIGDGISDVFAALEEHRSVAEKLRDKTRLD